MRNPCVDIVKGIAIIAVVLVHCKASFPFLGSYTCILGGMWHVPVFFVIAGFFLKEENVLRPVLFVKKKIGSLYFKLLCFYIPAVLLHNVLLNAGLYSVNDPDLAGKTMHLYSASNFILKLIQTIMFAGREPIMGAMWFAYVLFLSLVAYSIISFVIDKFYKEDKYWIVKGLIFFTLAMISNILSNKYSLTLNRFSNSISAMFLIYLGQLFNVKLKLKFDSLPAFCGAFLLFVHEIIYSGSISLNNNFFHGVFHLACGGGATTYMLMFASKKISTSHFGKILAIVGKHSFTIMALHLVCFKLCTMILNNLFDYSFPLQYICPYVQENYLCMGAYLLTGTFVPVILAEIFGKMQRKIINK